MNVYLESPTAATAPCLRASFFDRFAPADLVEFRCLKPGAEPRIFFRRSADLDGLWPTLKALNVDGYHIYAGVNPRSRTKGDEASVDRLVAFHADVDALARAVRSASKPRQERDAPAPSLTVASGHGKHLYWLLREPVQVTDANRQHLKAINRGLALAVDGDPACSDLSRILRVPEFTNHKPPAAEVRLLDANARRYTLAELMPFAVAAPSTQRRAAVTVPPTAPAPLPQELSDRFHQWRRADKTGQRSRAWRGEIGDGSSESRFVLVKLLTASAEFTPSEIFRIVCSKRWYNRYSKAVKAPGDPLTARHVARILSELG